jgi:uncharacterized protein
MLGQPHAREKTLRLLSGILLLSVSVAVHAASFDCAKARSPQEKAICASPELSKADDEMAAAYKAALAQAPAGFQDRVRDGQRAWIRRIQLTCLPGDAKRPIEACLLDAYKQRTPALKNMMLTAGGVKFIWSSVSFTVPDSPETAALDAQRGVIPVATFDASWPQAVSDSPEWQVWNAAIEDAARGLASQGNDGPDRKWKPEWVQDMDTDLRTTIGIVTPQLVTAEITNNWYGHGAAHPNTSSSQFNWMLQQKHALRPEDVFGADSEWKRTLYERTDAYLHKALDADLGHDYKGDWAPGYAEKELHKILEDPGNWELDAKGITIVFQQYAIACRACTPEPFTMTWDSLKPLLNPGFEVPQP